MDELINAIYQDLTAELESTDENFNADLLLIKVKGATKEVKQARHYPSNYTDEMVVSDMNSYYMNIRDIALYDYNIVGAEFQKSSSENSVQRTWVDRNSLFNGIVPISR